MRWGLSLVCTGYWLAPVHCVLQLLNWCRPCCWVQHCRGWGGCGIRSAAQSHHSRWPVLWDGAPFVQLLKLQLLSFLLLQSSTISFFFCYCCLSSHSPLWFSVVAAFMFMQHWILHPTTTLIDLVWFLINCLLCCFSICVPLTGLNTWYFCVLHFCFAFLCCFLFFLECISVLDYMSLGFMSLVVSWLKALLQYVFVLNNLLSFLG